MSRRSTAERTAFGPMVIAACEQYAPPAQRLVDDDLAVRFLPPGQRLVVRACARPAFLRLLVGATERQATGLWAGMLCRKRYLDDQVRDVLGAGVDQLVVLGAGLDTRAQRLTRDPARDVRAFEVDLPTNTADKQRLVRAVLGDRSGSVTMVALDLATDDLVPVLVRHGFHPDRPAVVVWEAVTQYLTADAVHRTLEALTRLAPGSRLLFTYIRQDFLDGTHPYGAAPVRKRMTGIWHYGLNPADVGSLLEQYGWSEREDVGPAEYRQRYPATTARQLPISEIERCVHAGKH